MDPSKKEKTRQGWRSNPCPATPCLLQSRRDVQGAPATRDTLCRRLVQEQSCEHGHHGRARVHPLAHGPLARGPFARGPFARGPFALGLAPRLTLGPALGFALGLALRLTLGPALGFALGLALRLAL